jgi:hypothetical protein
MPITDLATNVILDNVGKVYFLKTGVYRDPVGLDNNHPLSSVSAMLIHIEDGVPQNVMLANYAPSKMASWASHDFPLWYRGQVEYTIAGESAPRTFAQYFTYVPSILVAMNKNGASIMDVNVTITQNTGANLLGGFADLTALNAEFPPTEELSDDVATAYVYDSGTKGFYRVAWNGVSAWEWTLISTALVTYGVQTKQYNVLPIKVQRGYAPSQTPLTVSDEVVRLIYQEIAYINAVIANHTELIDDLNTDIINHLADYNNPHQVTAEQLIFDNTGTDLISTDLDGAIKEVNTKANANEQDILDLQTNKEDKSNKATAWGTPNDTEYPTTKLVDDRLDPIETFKDTTVPATYETIVNVDAKLLLKEDLINKVINFLVIDDVKYPSVQATETRIDSKFSAHNISGTAHADIRALISALQGAYVFRGFITVYAGTEPTPTELNNRITALLSRSPVVGDVLIDNSEIEWYFDGTNWNNMGQAIIALASAVNDGLMSKEDYAKLLALPTNATLTSLLDAKIAKSQIVNDLTTGGATDVLSAEQGKQLNIEVGKKADKLIDSPIEELNGYSLKEVFSDGNLISINDFTSDVRITKEIINNELIITQSSSENPGYTSTGNKLVNKKYFVGTHQKNISSSVGTRALSIIIHSGGTLATYLSANTLNTNVNFVSQIQDFTALINITTGIFRYQSPSSVIGEQVLYKDPIIVDLEMFGIGNIDYDTLLDYYLLWYENKDKEIVEYSIYANTLLGTKYIDDNIYVQHEEEKNKSTYTIYSQVKSDDGNIYLGLGFRNHPNSMINLNVWDLWKVRIYKKENGVFSYQNKELIMDGNWETAIREINKSDYIGGHAHGDEVYNYFRFILDGKILIPEGNYIEIGKNIEIIQKTEINRVDTPLEIIANKSINYQISSNEIVFDQIITWLEVITTETSYLAMCPVKRVDGTNQVTSIGYFDEDYEILDISLDNHGNTGLKANSKVVTLFNDLQGYNFVLKMEEIIGSTIETNRKVISDSPQYNKIYFDYVGSGINHVTSVGEKWRQKVKYTLKYKE